MQPWVYFVIYFLSVFLASCSQILLKKSAQKKYDSKIKEYLNPLVIGAYAVFAITAVMSVVAYKVVPLSLGPVIETTGYIHIAILSLIFLKEKMTRRKAAGTLLIILGIVVFSLL